MLITSSKLLALSAQFGAMADQMEAKRSTVPVGSNDDHDLGYARRSLSRASARLIDSDLNAALDELEPHYDAMLSAVRGLNAEVEHEQRVARVLTVVASALAMSSAFLEGNPVALLTAIGDASQLLS